MKKKYNIAFMPKTKSGEFVELSNKFSDFSDKYLLGERSLPHVTVCQFLASEKNIARIWAEVCETVSQLEIELIFEKFSMISMVGWNWISLIPDNYAKLYEIHMQVAGIVGKPINFSYSDYDPHLSLINSLDKDFESKAADVVKRYEVIKDKFALSLGYCDEYGQITGLVEDVKIES